VIGGLISLAVACLPLVGAVVFFLVLAKRIDDRERTR
jgi:hypothetical protein